MAGCELCQCNAYKQCQRHMDSRYKAFENLKSGCGADLYFQLQNSDGSPVNAPHMLPITLEVPSDKLHMPVWRLQRASTNALVIFLYIWDCVLLSLLLSCCPASMSCGASCDSTLCMQISAINARIYKTAIESCAGQIEEDDLVKCELAANKEVSPSTCTTGHLVRACSNLLKLKYIPC